MSQAMSSAKLVYYHLSEMVFVVSFDSFYSTNQQIDHKCRSAGRRRKLQFVFYLPKESTNSERKYYGGEWRREQADKMREMLLQGKQAYRGVFYYEHFYLCERTWRDRMKNEQNIVIYDVRIKPTSKCLQFRPQFTCYHDVLSCEVEKQLSLTTLSVW